MIEGDGANPFGGDETRERELRLQQGQGTWVLSHPPVILGELTSGFPLPKAKPGQGTSS